MSRFRPGEGGRVSPVISCARSGQNGLMRLGTRVAVALCVVAACVAASASVARADGDPASDYLVARQVFVSSQRVVDSRAQRELLATVAAANRDGFPIRVAIISSDYDMGSITALWRRPALYARFLGLELASAYRGRLLVVMPNGFGFNGPAQPMRREHGCWRTRHRTGVGRVAGRGADGGPPACRRRRCRRGVSDRHGRRVSRTPKAVAAGRS